MDHRAVLERAGQHLERDPAGDQQVGGLGGVEVEQPLRLPGAERLGRESLYEPGESDA